MNKGNIFQLTKQCIIENDLIHPKDRVLMGLSGGKDSMSCLLVLNGLKEELDFELGACFVAYPMNVPEVLRDFCLDKNIPLYVRETEGLDKLDCMACSRLRRKHLLLCAEGENYNKIALGHNYEDNAETTLMNLFTGRGCEKLSPKRVYFEKYTIIRPFLYVTEKKIINYVNKHNIPISENKCDNLPNCGRIMVRNILKEMNKKYQNIYENILK